MVAVKNGATPQPQVGQRLLRDNATVSGTVTLPFPLRQCAIRHTEFIIFTIWLWVVIYIHAGTGVPPYAPPAVCVAGAIIGANYAHNPSQIGL